MTKKIKQLDPGILGYGNTDMKAVSVDAFAYEDFDVVLPEITFAVLEERFSDGLDGLTAATFDRFDAGGKTDAVIEAFQQSDAFYEWKDSFAPMMLYYWPLFMHGKDAERIATLLEEFAPCVSLIEIRDGSSLHEAVSEDHAFVLTGGGMDLSDHLALAYICAGAIPPTALLTGLSNSMGKRRLKQCRKALQAAYDGAESAVEMELERLKRERKAIFSRKLRND